MDLELFCIIAVTDSDAGTGEEKEEMLPALASELSVQPFSSLLFSRCGLKRVASETRD